MSTLTATPAALVAAPAGSLTTAKGSAPASDIPVDSAILPARIPIHSREETLMKPLDAALSPAPDRSIRPSEPRSSDEGQRGHGQLISAGSLRSLDTANGPGGSVAKGASDAADSVRPAPEQAAAAAMPNFLDRQEVNAMIRKLRQSVSLWKRIQNVRVDDQRLEQIRDDLLSLQQLIR
ncbi:hypothetical protein ACWF5H_01025 [Arthrobacter sp. NPDC055138]